MTRRKQHMAVFGERSSFPGRITPKGLQVELSKQKGAVLLACVRTVDHDLATLQELLTICQAFVQNGRLAAVRRMDEDWAYEFRLRFGVLGTPAFLLFVDGGEVARLMGDVKPAALRQFLSQRIPSAGLEKQLREQSKGESDV